MISWPFLYTSLCLLFRCIPPPCLYSMCTFVNAGPAPFDDDPFGSFGKTPQKQTLGLDRFAHRVEEAGLQLPKKIYYIYIYNHPPPKKVQERGGYAPKLVLFTCFFLGFPREKFIHHVAFAGGVEDGWGGQRQFEPPPPPV